MAAAGGGDLGRGGGRHKGPEAARAETRDVARPLRRPQLQVRARPPAESGRVMRAGAGAAGSSRLRLCDFVLSVRHPPARSELETS